MCPKTNFLLRFLRLTLGPSDLLRVSNTLKASVLKPVREKY